MCFNYISWEKNYIFKLYCLTIFLTLKCLSIFLNGKSSKSSKNDIDKKEIVPEKAIQYVSLCFNITKEGATSALEFNEKWPQYH